MSEINKLIYESKDVVDVYALDDRLQPAERNIVDILKSRLSAMRMLDIGIGAGRTTSYFISLVKHYVGIDYAQNMIRSCQERFANSAAAFKVCDVRDMKIFSDESFDFVLFSYNGIDYMPHEERIKAFREIKRVLALKGVFCFSTHNTQYISRFYKITLCKSPMRFCQVLKIYWQVRSLLKQYGSFDKIPYAIINDGGEEFRAQTHYIAPQLQIKQLHQIGFKTIRVFSENSGGEIQDHNLLNGMTSDRWFYFLCTN